MITYNNEKRTNALSLDHTRINLPLIRSTSNPKGEPAVFIEDVCIGSISGFGPNNADFDNFKKFIELVHDLLTDLNDRVKALEDTPVAPPAELSSITLSGWSISPKTVNVGQQITVTVGTVTASKSDGTSAPVTSGITTKVTLNGTDITPSDTSKTFTVTPNTEGTVQVTVSYNDGKKTVSTSPESLKATVGDALSRIECTGYSANAKYKVGEEISITIGTVTAFYAASQKTVTNDVTYTVTIGGTTASHKVESGKIKVTANKAGDVALKVSYSDKYGTQEKTNVVTSKVIELSSINLNGWSISPKTINVGQQLTVTVGTVTAVYSDSSTETVTSGITTKVALNTTDITPSDVSKTFTLSPSAEGTVQVTVSYNNGIKTVSSAPSELSATVGAAPKVTYWAGIIKNENLTDAYMANLLKTSPMSILQETFESEGITITIPAKSTEYPVKSAYGTIAWPNTYELVSWEMISEGETVSSQIESKYVYNPEDMPQYSYYFNTTYVQESDTTIKFIFQKK